MTTRAARLYAPGEPLRVEEAPLPEPGAGEVRVELRYAGVNPLDTYAAAGRVGDLSTLPRTLGVEASGYLEGRPVLVHGAGVGLTRDGVWAERAVVPRAAVVDVPDGVDLAAAGGLGVVGATAWRVVHDLGRPRPADRVLVLAAAGGVGNLVVQLAKAAGATVWGQIGSAGKRDFVGDLGADEVVVTGAAGLPAAVAGLRPTVVFDALGGGFFPAAVEALQLGGRIVLYGASAGPQVTFDAPTLYRKGLSVLGYGGVNEPPERLAEATGAVLAEIAAGRLRLPVSDVLPLGRVEEAMERIRARGTAGKLLLDVRA